MSGPVVDATVLIDHLRGHPAATTYLSGLAAPPPCSELTRVEVGRGLRSAERQAARALFAGIDWVPVDAEIASEAAELGRRYRRSHRTIDLADLVVAATARVRGVTPVTTNVKHFPMFPGLVAPYT